MMRAIKVEKPKDLKMEAVPCDIVQFPSLYISTQYLPEAKEWEVGEEYEVTLRVRQTGLSVRKGRDGKEHGSADFDIIGIDPKGKAKKDKPKRYQ